MATKVKRNLTDEILERVDANFTDVVPPLPKKIEFEINNSCNHKCFFCQNPIMNRGRRVIDDVIVHRVLQEAFDGGAREASFYNTGEPFLNRSLPDYVAAAKKIGFEYIYLSTNGGRVVTDRFIPVLDAGLDSLKFSVNAGDRETYALTHGIDEFEDVMSNIEAVAAYRERTGRPSNLFVSFVDTDISRPTLDSLKRRIGHLVDQVVVYPFVITGTPLKLRIERDGTRRPFRDYDDVDPQRYAELKVEAPCSSLWNYLNVTVEGYLKACCTDFNNDLVVGNLNSSSLLDAWHSPEFQAFRRRHIEGNVAGTLCDGCIRRCHRPYEALNPHLKTNEWKTRR